MNSGWIVPPGARVGDYWVTRRAEDAAPEYKFDLPDIRERFRWNGSAWITGYYPNGQPVLCQIHSNNGWRIEPKVNAMTDEEREFHIRQELAKAASLDAARLTLDERLVVKHALRIALEDGSLFAGSQHEDSEVNRLIDNIRQKLRIDP